MSRFAWGTMQPTAIPEAASRSHTKSPGGCLPFNDPRVDACLPGGGLPLGQLHEIGAAGLDAETAALPTAFIAALLARIAPEKPDFRIIAMPPDDFRPGACILGQGGNEGYLVYAQRSDGFKGDIQLTMEGLPAGLTCPPQVLAGQPAHEQGLAHGITRPGRPACRGCRGCRRSAGSRR